MRKRSMGWASLVAAGLLLATVAPVATAASPKDHFKPSAVTAPWSGEVDANPDSRPNSWGLCRTLASTANFSYAVPSAGEVDAIVNDALNNSGASNRGCTTAQNETTIAVNPQNPQNLIAGANDYRVCCDLDGLNDGTGWAYYSNDGGQTWGNVQVPGLTVETGGQGNFKLMDSAGDPVMAFGADGTAYYANIVFSRVSPASGVAVSVSTDGGKTWGAPKMVAYQSSANFFNDKEWLAAGPNGSVAVTWTVFNQGARGAGYISSKIVGAYSMNHGQSWNSQGSPVSDAAHPYNQGSQVGFAPDGSLIVAYEGATPSSGYSQDGLILARSTNGGNSFSTQELARVYDDFSCYPVYGLADPRQTLTGEHFRLNSYPAMSIDPTNGTIAIAWADDQGVGNCGTADPAFTGTATNAQVKLMSGSWSTIAGNGVTMVTSDTGDKVFPGVAANKGRITVSYYTRGYAASEANPACFYAIPDNLPPGANVVTVANSVCLDYASKSSADGFSAERRLTSQGSNPYVQFADGSFIGDYSQVAMGSDGVSHAAWTDFRGNPSIAGNGPNQDVYVSSFR
jgi:hypothetical protein